MGNLNRHTAAAVIASSVLLAVSWVASAHADSSNRDACHEAIRLTEAMANKNAEVIGTMAARSGSMHVGDTEIVDRLTPVLRQRQQEYTELHQAFRDAAANC